MDNYTMYPKQFNKNIIPVERNRCFVLMPFDSQYDSLYGHIKKKLNDMQLICNRDDEIPGSAPFMNKVITEIIKSRYIIVVLSKLRPNVLYELGIAHTLKDLQNVLLIKEKGLNEVNDIYKNASDISHLTYIEYEPQNMFYLTSQIQNFIESNKYIADFYEILNVKKIINIVTETNQFAEYVQSELKEKTNVIIKILSGEQCLEEEYFNLLNMYLSAMLNIIKLNKLEWIEQLTKLYAEILIGGKNFSNTEQYCYSFLHSILNQFPNINENNIINWQTLFVIQLAENKCFLNIVLPWIINYFKKSKSTTIDLNRYKLESFLMTCNYNEVNQLIINSLRNDDRHVREHMADIIGEKNLVEARDLLTLQLANESNIYTASSMFEALGKIGATLAKNTILKWTLAHENIIRQGENHFVLKHAYNALQKLTIDEKDENMSKFKEYFGEDLSRYYFINF